ncbi:MAG: hypothetical protein WA941_15720 [Nitrososphaeraceae archaeon]
MESTISRDYTLQEFLNIWGVGLDGKTVKMAVNAKPVSNICNHVLGDGEQIRLEIQ